MSCCRHGAVRWDSRAGFRYNTRVPPWSPGEALRTGLQRLFLVTYTRWGCVPRQSIRHDLALPSHRFPVIYGPTTHSPGVKFSNDFSRAGAGVCVPGERLKGRASLTGSMLPRRCFPPHRKRKPRGAFALFSIGIPWSGSNLSAASIFQPPCIEASDHPDGRGSSLLWPQSVPGDYCVS
jgi:hypothetical protein